MQKLMKTKCLNEEILALSVLSDVETLNSYALAATMLPPL